MKRIISSISIALFDLMAGLIVGYAVFSNTNMLSAAIATCVMASLLSQVGISALLKQQIFGKNCPYFKILNDRFSSKKICPAFLDDIQHEIDLITNIDESSLLKELLSHKTTGRYVEWDRYAELLKSSLCRATGAFIATCQLTPSQFMNPVFIRYRDCQEIHLRNPLWMLNRRFRIIAVDKDILLQNLNESAEIERETISFFKWHNNLSIPLYFVSQNKYSNYLKTFDLSLNDFVCFLDAEEQVHWVVGVFTTLGDNQDIEGALLNVFVFDDATKVQQYKKFALSLRKHAATRRIKNIDRLRIWLAKGE